jgi:Skp family chaperone for outer membrane proteins
MSQKIFIILTMVYSANRLAFAEPVSIATFNYFQALHSVDAGKKANDSLNLLFKSKEDELKNGEAELHQLIEQGKKQTSVKSEAANKKAEEVIRKKAQELHKKQVQFQMEMKSEEEKLLKPIDKALREIVSKIAKERKLSAVLTKTDENTPNMLPSVIYSDPSIVPDVTYSVIERFNAEYAELSKGKK